MWKPRANLRWAAAGAVGALGMALILGASLQEGGRYVKPPKPEPGSAPGMRYQRLSNESEERHFVVTLAPGDEILGGLTDFAEQEHLGAAQITAIGGVHDATLGFFDQNRKLFREIPIGEQAEVTSLVGDIALVGDQPVVHLHMTLALPDGTVRGGHLLHAHVDPTLEVMITESPHAMHKVHEEALGLDLIAPDGAP
jgi:uncharacterized protein